MTFWDGWALWLKMTFILAIGIVLVVSAGCIQLLWMHRNLRKHVKLLQEKQAEQAALMARPSVRERRRKAEVPFGVRAMESGVEIEGIWISRPNSTATSAVHSPVLSGTATPTSPPPHELHRKGIETAVSGAARVLANKVATRPVSARTYSDPFRDSRANSEAAPLTNGSGASSSSSETRSPYYDLPDAELGFGGARVPSNPSMQQSIRRMPSYTAGKNGQPAFYRPSGTPDPESQPRNSFIPKYLQTRALSQEQNLIDPLLVNSPEEGDTLSHHPYGSATGPIRSSGQGQRSSSIETSFVTPAGMMPVASGASQSSSFNGRPRRQRSTKQSLETNPEEEEEPYSDHPVSGRYNAIDSDPRRVSRQQKLPSHEPHRPQRHRSSQPPITSINSSSNMTALPQHRPTSFATRADAEAAASDMRRVNEGFSVSRHGVRRNRESLIAEAQELKEERTRREREREREQEREQARVIKNEGFVEASGARDADKDNRRRLQKKRGSIAPAGRRDSQFREQM